MSSVPIQVDGVLWDHADKSGRKVSLIGQASIVGLSVGGGPIVPPDEPPLVIWGPNDPRPTPPIYLPPEGPPPEGPADDDGFIKPPPAGGGWGYHEKYGWMYDPGESGSGPK